MVQKSRNNQMAQGIHPTMPSSLASSRLDADAEKPVGISKVGFIATNILKTELKTHSPDKEHLTGSQLCQLKRI
jgi:hypothetical protein